MLNYQRVSFMILYELLGNNEDIATRHIEVLGDRAAPNSAPVVVAARPLLMAR